MTKMTDRELLETFEEAKDIIPQKIREWREERETISQEISKSLALAMDKDEVTKEVWTEFIALEYGPQLTQIDKHLSRLSRQYKVMFGQAEDRITDDMVERAKAVPVESLFDTELRRSGRNLSGLCPFHQEKTPSFTVFPAKNRCWCFGCNQGGDSIEVVQKLHGYSFPQAVRYLEARA